MWLVLEACSLTQFLTLLGSTLEGNWSDLTAMDTACIAVAVAAAYAYVGFIVTGFLC